MPVYNIVHCDLPPTYKNSSGIFPKSFTGNSLDKLSHPISDAYSTEQVLLIKQQIWCGPAYPDCYRFSS